MADYIKLLCWVEGRQKGKKNKKQRAERIHYDSRCPLLFQLKNIKS